MNSSPTKEAIEKLTEDYKNAVLQHCDSVKIFLTWQEEGTTESVSELGGNVYASIEVVREWLKLQDLYIDEHNQKVLEESEDD